MRKTAEEASLQEIARELGVSFQCVQIILKRALAKLRIELEKRKLSHDDLRPDRRD